MHYLSDMLLCLNYMSVVFNQIYDGPDQFSTPLGDYCGDKRPVPFESSGNALFISFASDATTTAGGYTIEYTVNSKTRKYDFLYMVHVADLLVLCWAFFFCLSSFCVLCPMLPVSLHCPLFGCLNFCLFVVCF